MEEINSTLYKNTNLIKECQIMWNSLIVSKPKQQPPLIYAKQIRGFSFISETVLLHRLHLLQTSSAAIKPP